VLVMTATPIPRTLALSLYGDLDVSVLDELPPGRTPIVTRRVPGERVGRSVGFVRKQVAQGRQAYIVYPVIEGSKDDQPELDFSHDDPGGRELAAPFGRIPGLRDLGPPLPKPSARAKRRSCFPRLRRKQIQPRNPA
jgi:ATP-dependent DNA helicase RecG